MKSIKIGNWFVTESNIKWTGEIYDCEIPLKEILEIREDAYDWLTHIVNKSWMKKEDIYSLIVAFVYAVEVNEHSNFKTDIFINTIKEIEEIIKINNL